ncbi:helix-turn-helix domain-containing protein [Longimicrobium terrae]|uniref:Transcriptional regulator with XRE-family HTH domain n=1 Tax=Longimicrobium terrae TaxID=1639882 RepID=A0A841H1Q3_9BACT|nr:helix-turn-helix transcriptional regulator [Longimicrobium terrae]MBB4637526.1 transcriptional regulator with XRE-family HTH domain [Longimicrobium terrae]MBB6071923.1 transcriptional regulator with XRE-family HTH domain [Longimicrobium terrae]NNC30470.1 helix-turn-helix transcriptional regulator [Longimicrobium terrae]
MQIYEYIGTAVRDQRTATRRTQQELADLAGLKRSTLAMIETGRQQISLDQLIDLARALQIDYRDLLPAPDYFMPTRNVRVTLDTMHDQAPTTAGLIARLQQNADPSHEPANKAKDSG